MRILRRLLLASTLTLVFLAPHAVAQDDVTDIDAPWLEETTFVIDGRLNESGWSDAGYAQVAMGGEGDDDERRYAHLYTATNGTHLFFAVILDAPETLTLQIDPSNGQDTAVRGLDTKRVSPDGSVEDLAWDPEAGRWVSDDEVDECSAEVEAAIGTADGSTVELARPLEGDPCDGFIPLGETVGIRIASTSGGETFAWPADSRGGLEPDAVDNEEIDDHVLDWADLTVLGRFGDTDQEVPAPDGGAQGEPGLYTGDQPELDPNQPIAPGGDPPSSAYDANERGTPGPGIVLIVLTGLVALGVVAVVRRDQG